MLVTALSPASGHQVAARIAEDAQARGVTLRQAAPEAGKVTETEHGRIIVPGDMIGRGVEGA